MRGERFDRILEQHALLDYAALNWRPHASVIQHEISVQACNLLQDINLVTCTNNVLNMHQFKNANNFHPMSMCPTGLHLVARLGLDFILEELLRLPNYLPADAKTMQMETPLMWAAYWGSTATVEVLLKRDDVDANCRAEYTGWSPLTPAAMQGHEAIARLLFQYSDLDVDCGDTLGKTPLIHAISGSRETFVELLLEKEDVNVNSKDRFGQPPLSWATRLGTATIAQLLLGRGALPDPKDNNFRTPLSYAAEWSCAETIRLLLDRGANPNSVDHYGQTPLHHAADNEDDPGGAALLLKHGAKVDVRDHKGQTPLHYATDWRSDGAEAMAKQLLEYGARPDVEDKNGMTPLALAMRQKHEAMIRLLETAQGVGCTA